MISNYAHDAAVQKDDNVEAVETAVALSDGQTLTTDDDVSSYRQYSPISRCSSSTSSTDVVGGGVAAVTFADVANYTQDSVDSSATTISVDADESEIDIGSETEADYLNSNNFDPTIIDDILNMSEEANSLFSATTNSCGDADDVKPMDAASCFMNNNNDELNSFESLDKELQSFIELLESQHDATMQLAARQPQCQPPHFQQQQCQAQQDDNRNVVVLNRLDVNEIISLIESKMATGGNDVTPAADHNQSMPYVGAGPESQSADSAQVQVVLQAPPDSGSCHGGSGGAGGQSVCAGKAIASIGLSQLDQILKQLLGKK